jgi:hypothetical protein
MTAVLCRQCCTAACTWQRRASRAGGLLVCLRGFPCCEQPQPARFSSKCEHGTAGCCKDGCCGTCKHEVAQLVGTMPVPCGLQNVHDAAAAPLNSDADRAVLQGTGFGCYTRTSLHPSQTQVVSHLDHIQCSVVLPVAQIARAWQHTEENLRIPPSKPGAALIRILDRQRCPGAWSQTQGRYACRGPAICGW